MKQFTTIFAIVLATILFPAMVFAQTWTGPTATPPGSNASVPLNISSTAQSKSGGLLLNTGGATNGLLVQSGNVGFGTVSPGANLEVNTGSVSSWTRAANVIDTSSSGYPYAFVGDSSNHGVILGHTNSGAASFGWLSYYGLNPVVGQGLILNSSGNVGIGTPSPISPLSFSASTGNKIDLWQDGANRYGFGIQGGLLQVYTPGGSIAFGAGNSTSFTEFMRINASGNVGIGTTNPQAKFSVNFNGGDMLNVYSPGDNQLALQTTLDGQPIGTYGSDANNVLLLQPSVGIVGIGTANTSFKLNVNGSVGATAFYYSSDARLKTDVAPLTDSLANILKLQGVSFTWASTSPLVGAKSVGLIAQDVEKVYPQLVETNPKTGLKSVEYANLVAPLIEAVKEQQKEIDSLKAEVDALKTSK